MAFPYVQDTKSSGNASLTTSHTVNLPDIVDDGDLIVVFFATTGDNVSTFPAGWQKIFNVNQSTNCHLSVAYLIADSTDSGQSITVSTTSSERSAAWSFTISDHNASTNPPEISTGDTGTDNEPNPDSVTASWGADDNLFIAMASNDNGLSISVNSYPTDFDDNQHTATSGSPSGPRMTVCSRDWSTNATQDPGIFELSGDSAHVAATMVVQGGTEGSSSSSTSSSSTSSSSSSLSSSSESSSSSSSSSCEFGTTIQWDVHFTNAAGGDWYESFLGGTYVGDSTSGVWVADDLGGGAASCAMDQFGGPAKAWTVGYRPDVARITIDSTSGFDLIIGSVGGTLYIDSGGGYFSGDIVPLTFSPDSDIAYITVDTLTAGVFNITNIEFGTYVCAEASSSSSSSSSSTSSSSSSSTTPDPCIPVVNDGATTQNSTGNQTNHVVTTPTHSQGDAIYIFASIDGNHNMSAPSGQGFSPVFEDELVPGNAATASVWRKVAGASEPATYTWTSASAERSVSIAFSVTNDGGVQVLGTKNTGDSSTVTCPSIDTTSAYNLILRFAWTDALTLPHTIDGTSYIRIAQHEYESSTTNSVWYAIQNDPGSTGTLDISISGNAPREWGAQTAAVLPSCSSSSSSSSSTSSSSSSRSSSSSSRSSSSRSSSSSSSSSSCLPGTVVWGHHTAVDETYDLDFTNNTSGWTIVGTPGSDGEAIDATACSQIITFDPHCLGVMTAVIKVDKYLTGYGPAPVIEYRTAATQPALLIAAWSVYNGVSFPSLGWVQIRFIHT